jgi:hypothetical protein
MTTTIELNDRDLTNFMVCKKCNRRGLGQPLGDINCKAYTKRDASMKPECENCGSEMTLIYEVK